MKGLPQPLWWALWLIGMAMARLDAGEPIACFLFGALAWDRVVVVASRVR